MTSACESATIKRNVSCESRTNLTPSSCGGTLGTISLVFAVRSAHCSSSQHEMRERRMRGENFGFVSLYLCKSTNVRALILFVQGRFVSADTHGDDSLVHKFAEQGRDKSKFLLCKIVPESHGKGQTVAFCLVHRVEYALPYLPPSRANEQQSPSTCMSTC